MFCNIEKVYFKNIFPRYFPYFFKLNKKKKYLQEVPIGICILDKIYLQKDFPNGNRSNQNTQKIFLKLVLGSILEISAWRAIYKDYIIVNLTEFYLF